MRHCIAFCILRLAPWSIASGRDTRVYARDRRASSVDDSKNSLRRQEEGGGGGGTNTTEVLNYY